MVESHRDTSRHHEEAIQRLEAQHKRLQHRIDAVYIDKIDGNVPAEFFETKAAEWRAEQEQCLRSIASHQNANDTYMHDGIRLLELADSAGRLFRKQSGDEKRKLLGFIVSNCTLADGRISVTLKQPFDMIAGATGHLKVSAPRDEEKSDGHPDWLGN